MQWLIDLVIAAIGIPPVFIDRGDPVIPDLTLIGMTTDAAWHDFDLSGIIPANAKAVLLRVYIVNTGISRQLLFREKGNVNDQNVSERHTQAAFIAKHADQIVALPASRIIQYLANAAGWVAINITVAGWWF